MSGEQFQIYCGHPHFRFVEGRVCCGVCGMRVGKHERTPGATLIQYHPHAKARHKR